MTNLNIYINKTKENWIVDRLREEFTENNPNIVRQMKKHKGPPGQDLPEVWKQVTELPHSAEFGEKHGAINQVFDALAGGGAGVPGAGPGRKRQGRGPQMIEDARCCV